MKKQTRGGDDERLLRIHQLHLGLYVSRVAKGKRTNERIKTQLLNELRKMEQEK